ncbi:hypothetical protein BRYFOR_05775 [Marvinbryantia formatexigens DSM 14469]|uniref:Uncharacterized protein n=1 Tax=Marvinbryantia formatexigens DSM 14469 TaxID=478749 RepID=C6LAY0_9FIRM|nr:hypothetical protein BRYFOR_05775 [Marvinbryantia formatexigens DSM 14469]
MKQLHFSQSHAKSCSCFRSNEKHLESASLLLGRGSRRLQIRKKSFLKTSFLKDFFLI